MPSRRLPGVLLALMTFGASMLSPAFDGPLKADAPQDYQKTTSDALGGPQRYEAHVSTDKPLYRPGEKVFVRTVLLDAGDHKPFLNPAWGMVEIIGPKGEKSAATKPFKGGDARLGSLRSRSRCSAP